MGKTSIGYVVVKANAQVNAIKNYLSKKSCANIVLSKIDKAFELARTWCKNNLPIAWIVRTTSELAMTWEDIGGIDGINAALIANYGNKYGEFKHVATSRCDDYYINENGDICEPDAKTEVVPGMETVWTTPYAVYIQRVIDLDNPNFSYVVKVGKTNQSMEKRCKDYNSEGRSRSTSETEKHYKDTLRADYIIEWYCINIPVQYTIRKGLKKPSVSFVYGQSPEIVEDEFRDILNNITGKKCLENITKTDMPK